MARLFNSIFLLIVVVGAGWYFRDFIIPPRPCAKPIAYTLGTFSGEFGVTKEYFLKAIADAEAIWEKAAGRELFTFKNESTPVLDIADRTMKVNLIYDYRQSTTDKLEGIGSVVEAKREDYDALRIRFESEKREYEMAKNAYDRDVENFNERQAAYEQNVNYWNSRGGAPLDEYQKMEAESQALEREAARLERNRQGVNAKASEVNSLVSRLNALARNLNLSVEHYNTVNDNRGETFEEGLYVAEGFNRGINIYEFGERAELVRVLAHELGHALTLDHVEDPKAIMYALNQGDNLALTKADLAELGSKCTALSI